MRSRDDYLICFGAFLVQCGVFGIHNNFGLFFDSLYKGYNVEISQIAWIGSCGMGTTFLVSPLAHIIYNRFGFNRLLGLSIVLCLVGWLSSSFVENVQFLIFTYSVLWGTGAGFANYAGTLIINQSFYGEQLSFANGLASSGTGFGALILGQLLTWMLREFGYRWTFRACSLVPLFYVFLFYSHKLRQKQNNIEPFHGKFDETSEDGTLENQKLTSDDNNNNLDNEAPKPSKPTKAFNLSELIDKELWRNMKFIIYLAGVSVYLFGAFIPFVFLISHAMENNITKENAQFLISILSIVSTITKVFSGFFLTLQNVIDRFSLLLAAMFIAALSNIIAARGTTYWHFCIFSIIAGLCEGCFVGQLPAVAVGLLPSKDKVAAAIGIMFSVISIPLMLGPLIAGYMVKGNSFVAPFYIATSVSFVGALLGAISKFLDAHDKSHVKDEEQVKMNCDGEHSLPSIDQDDLTKTLPLVVTTV